MADESVDLFQFMALRSAERVDPVNERLRFVRDCLLVPRPDTVVSSGTNATAAQALPAGQHDVDLFSPASPSPIGRTVYTSLFPATSTGAGMRKAGRPGGQAGAREAAIDGAEALLVQGFTYGSGTAAYLTGPIVETLEASQPVSPQQAMSLGALTRRRSYTARGTLHLLPDRLADLPTPMRSTLLAASAFFAEARATPRPGTDSLDDTFLKKLQVALGLDASTSALVSLVFNDAGGHASAFALTRRVLFDVLYALYVLRRRHELSLEPALQGLALCHTLEALATRQYLSAVLDGRAAPPRILATFSTVWPSLAAAPLSGEAGLERLTALGLLAPRNFSELEALLRATPVVHPLFARLDRAFAPFNSLVPIGLGDLKVVKQKFLGYRKGEIAHIETVLDGESKTRVHRALDRSENTFSVSSSSETETSKDTQSTSRFELKNEAEQAIKTDLALNANATVTYKGNPVVDASLAAGMSFTNSRSATEKSSKNFVNEVLAKATSRVQSRVAQQRSQTRITESEETSTHGFTNAAGNGHISGIYRWLDKIYEGQVYDFGKRMMFEFVVPEPAAFYVESRLHAHAAALPIPKYPVATQSGGGDVPRMPVGSPGEIDEATYQELSRTYDLRDFPYPAATLAAVPVKTTSGELAFHKGVPYDVTNPAITETFTGVLGSVPAGYTVSAVRVTGSAEFVQRAEANPDWINTLDVSINGRLVFHRVDETQKTWTDVNQLGAPARGVAPPELTRPPLPAGFAAGAEVRIDVFTKTCLSHQLSLELDLERGPAVLTAWQDAVFNEVARRVNQGGQSTAGAQDLESRRIAYRRQLAELRAKTVNEITQGRSEAWNEAQVRTELKRQCLAMIAKEFDADASDDLLPAVAGVARRAVDVDFPVLDVVEGYEKPGGSVVEASVRFRDQPDDPVPTFTAPSIDDARARGRLVRFLEQSFEWAQLSYVFYPYFWARMPEWIQLMDREDPSDPMFTEFLRAGSARVVLAVRPGHENAVLHFLATREPWLGGPSPVIGDPLFLPLYEEIRDAQDDVAGGTPSGEPWTFALPTSLVYLESERYPLVKEYRPDPPV